MCHPILATETFDRWVSQTLNMTDWRCLKNRFVLLRIFTFVSSVLMFLIFIVVVNDYDKSRVYHCTNASCFNNLTQLQHEFLKFKVAAECDSLSSLAHYAHYETITVFTNITLNSSCLYYENEDHLTVDEILRKVDDRFQMGIHQLQNGTWLINCTLPKFPTKRFTGGPIIDWQTNTSLLNQWRTVFEQTSIKDNETSSIISGTTILIRRHEYANIYWTLMDVYDAVLVCKYLGLEPRDVNILLFDSHSYGLLDPFWDVFKTVWRVRMLPGLTKFRNLIFSFPRRHSPLLYHDPQKETPALHEFKTLVHSLHKETVFDFDKNRCKDLMFRILFIWRHDYSSRPGRNTTLSRKLRNEDAILSLSKLTFAKSQVIGLQLDQLSVSDQLRWISKTDILIGMHGAALGYAVLLPKGSALVELLPNNRHMSYLAYNNDVHYVKYTNKSRTVGDDISRSVPPGDVTGVIQQAINKICDVVKQSAMT